MTTVNDQTNEICTITGLTKTRAASAVRWLRRRNYIAFYRAEDKSLNAFVTKNGRDATEAVMRRALAETVK